MSRYASRPADRNKIYWLEQSHSDLPTDNKWLTSDELETFSALRFPKRREDWRLGRWTAKSCISAYAKMSGVPLDLSRIEILAKPSGAPIGVLLDRGTRLSISLTHRAGKAMCAFAPSGTSVGCDLELIETRSREFLSDYFTQEEQFLVECTATQERALVLNMLWSAKESALKAMYLGLRVDTRSVGVRRLSHKDDAWLDSPPINLSKGTKSIHDQTWQRVLVTVADEPDFHGWWSASDAFVRTIVLRSVDSCTKGRDSALEAVG